MDSYNEPGKAVLAIYDKLIELIKQAKPVRSDDKPLGGVVYSMLILGMPVDPQDYMNPWVPQGDINEKDAIAKEELPSNDSDVDTSYMGQSLEANRALAAAYKTSALCNTMLQVTTDDLYLEYPTGRHLDFAYEGIIKGMQSANPEEAPDPNVEAAVNAAQKVLYKLNADGTVNLAKQSDIYQKYLSNTRSYGMAVASFAEAYANAQANPRLMRLWPVTSRTYQNNVNQARAQLINDGASEVEKALDTLASVGEEVAKHMVAKARELFDGWNLNQTGAVPVNMPYSYILPTNWADPDDHDGWVTLSVSANSYSSYDVKKASTESKYSWFRKSSSTGGGGAVSLGFIVLGGGGSTASSNSGNQNTNQSHASDEYYYDAKNLDITLEYGLCTIMRPWLVSDLFYMPGWYLKGAKRNSISDGTQDNQANLTDSSKLPLLPMIPQQILVIRNVTIRAGEWGSVRDILSNAYGDSESSSESHATSVKGSAGVSLGFINFGGAASHTDSSAKGQGSSFSASDSSSYFGTTFQNETLHIPGAQIVAWLSDIVPACPPLDDPEYGTSVAASAKTSV